MYTAEKEKININKVSSSVRVFECVHAEEAPRGRVTKFLWRWKLDKSSTHRILEWQKTIMSEHL